MEILAARLSRASRKVLPEPEIRVRVSAQLKPLTQSADPDLRKAAQWLDTLLEFLSACGAEEFPMQSQALDKLQAMAATNSHQGLAKIVNLARFHHLASLIERPTHRTDLEHAEKHAYLLLAAEPSGSLAAAAVAELALIAWQHGHTAEAESHLRDALMRYQEIGDEAATADIHVRLGDIQKGKHRYHRALQFYQEAQALAERENYPYIISSIQIRIGNVYRLLGRVAEADRYYRNALEQQREAGDFTGQQESWQRIAVLAEQQGNLVDAQACFQESLALAMRGDDAAQLACRYLDLTRIERRLGHLERARSYCEQGLRLLQQKHEYASLAWGYCELGDLERQLAAYPAALECYQRSLVLYEQAGTPNLVIIPCIRLGDMSIASGKHDDAFRWYNKAREIGNALEDKQAGDVIAARLSRLARLSPN